MEAILLIGIRTHKRLQPRRREEGFDRLYCVTVTNEFVVEECAEEP